MPPDSASASARLAEPGVPEALFRLGWQVMKAHGVAALALPPVFIAGIWHTAPRQRLLAWALAHLACDLWAWGLVWRFRRQARTHTPATPSTLRRWQWGEWAFVLPTGWTWGACGALMVPGQATHNLMVMTAFVGVVGYTTATVPLTNLRAYLVALLSADVLMSLQLHVAYADQAALVIGMLIVYTMVLSLAAWFSHRQSVDNIRLRLANEALADQHADEARRAEQANREKSAFLAAASHDLRQPVHALMMLVGALREQLVGSAQEPLVAHIQQAGETIGKLFSSLMALSKLESGHEKAHNCQLDLEALVRQAVHRHAWLADNRGLQLSCRVSRRQALWQVHSDPVLLNRVLDNLIGNALRYTERGRVLVTLRRRGTHGIDLDVLDTGIGIAPDDLGRIFEPYVQVGNAERDRSRGLGLGLATVRRIVDLLGLSLSVHSRPGHGSRFRLSLEALPLPLPADRVNAEGPLHDPLPELPVASPQELAGVRMLLIDDDPMVRQALHTLVSGWHIDLRSVGNGQECDSWAPRWASDGWQPALILSDHRLPGGELGIALLDRLQKRYPQALLLLQTGELSPDVHAEAEEAGLVVLTKPVSAELLRQTLGSMLRASQAAPR